MILQKGIKMQLISTHLPQINHSCLNLAYYYSFNDRSDQIIEQQIYIGAASLFNYTDYTGEPLLLTSFYTLTFDHWQNLVSFL